MFEQKVDAQDAGTASTIDQWKDSVSRFFSGEWDNLRELIRRLEEKNWDGVEVSAPQTTAPRRPVRISQPAAEPERPATVVNGNSDQARLDDLAKRLERRLQESSTHV